MIKLYYWPTPNGRKITIMLEELRVPYKIHLVDISNKKQFSKKFSRISPSNKIPAIFDEENKQSELLLKHKNNSPQNPEILRIVKNEQPVFKDEEEEEVDKDQDKEGLVKGETDLQDIELGDQGDDLAIEGLEEVNL